jgi:NAD-dependent protein deacetylase/lipoamidase
MTDYRNIVILTGAGISAESGLGTFRGAGGLWEKIDPYKLATPEAFAENPDRVNAFYNMRRAGVLAARPNAAHDALARWEAAHGRAGGDFLLITQNVDDLHERAGSERLLHMHGELAKSRCSRCGDIRVCEADLSVAAVCKACGAVGSMRPHVVWFGEVPFELDRIGDALDACDLFVAIGTSGTVYPAAGFVHHVRMAGRAHTVEINLEPSDGRSDFAERIYGPASETVPAFVETLLARA